MVVPFVEEIFLKPTWMKQSPTNFTKYNKKYSYEKI